MKCNSNTIRWAPGYFLGCVLLVMVGMTFSAQADTLTFEPAESPPNSSAGAIAALVAQVSVEYLDVGGTAVSFQFLNNVGFASSITDIYIGESLPGGLLLLPPTMTDSDGAGETNVVFAPPAAPGDFQPDPFADPPATQLLYSTDANSAPQGINTSTEWLTLTFNYGAGMDFTDVQAALLSGDLLIGLHISSINGPNDNDESDWFLNRPPDDPSVPIPEPASLALLGLGIGALALRKRLS